MSEPDSSPHPHTDWRHAHAHEPNPTPPTEDASFILTQPAQAAQHILLADFASLPHQTIADCYIVSTGHGTSGPFHFGGVPLAKLLRHYCQPADLTRYQAGHVVEVISADGFGTRLLLSEIFAPNPRPILLSDTLDGQPLTRAQGLIRLIVPSETDDALRQVKWVARIQIVAV